MKKVFSIILIGVLLVVVCVILFKDNNSKLAASDLLTPTIEIDGVAYTFPIEAKELIDNGWTMENKLAVPATPGANAGVNFTKDDYTLFTNISSTTGKEQKIEEGEVCSIHYAKDVENINVPIKFPGEIAIGMKKADVEKILPGEFEYVEKYQYFQYKKETDKGELEILIYMSEDGSEVEKINYTCWTK